MAPQCAHVFSVNNGECIKCCLNHRTTATEISKTNYSHFWTFSSKILLLRCKCPAESRRQRGGVFPVRGHQKRPCCLPTGNSWILTYCACWARISLLRTETFPNEVVKSRGIHSQYAHWHTWKCVFFRKSENDSDLKSFFQPNMSRKKIIGTKIVYLSTHETHRLTHT